MAFSDDVQDIVGQVEKTTGYRVQALPDTALKVFATLTTATPKNPIHVIRYNPSKPAIDYHVAFECGFLLRLFQNPPNDRHQFAAVGEAQKLIQRAVASNKHIRTMGLPSDSIDTLAKQFFDGVMIQLRSTPTGMRVDEWIWKDYAALRPLQTESMKAQMRENVQALRPDIKKIAPENIWVANVSMNAAYALFFERMTGDYGHSVAYRSAGFEKAAEGLLHILDETPTEATSDCTLVDAWAKELHFDGWYEWIPLPQP